MLGDEGLPFIPNFYDVKELPKDYIYEKMEEEFDQQIGMYPPCIHVSINETRRRMDIKELEKIKRW